MKGTIEQQLRAITGSQRVIVTCWCCDTDYPEGSDRYRIDPDGFPVCADDNACNYRAAKAGLVAMASAPEAADIGKLTTLAVGLTTVAAHLKGRPRVVAAVAATRAWERLEEAERAEGSEAA